MSNLKRNFVNLPSLTEIHPPVLLPISHPPTTDTHNHQQSKTTTILLLHGLGSKNPSIKGYNTDEWITYFNPLFNSINNLKNVRYTARGHKGSVGWEPLPDNGDDTTSINKDLLKDGNSIYVS